MLVCVCLQVKLDFCDLGRSIAGRPEDPISLRPFEFAFTKEKIINSVAKLGLNPVHLKTALLHKRVRDDSGDGSRGQMETSIRARHARLSANLGADGLNTAILHVPAPPPAVAPVLRLVASPSQAEKRYKALKAAGSCPGAIFHSVGAKAFNAPEITHVAMERKLEKDALEEEKNRTASSDFILLRTKCSYIFELMEEEHKDWDELLGNERNSFISYVFKARGTQGMGKHTGSTEAALTFLRELGMGELSKLLEDPPCLKGKGRVAKGTSAVVIVAEMHVEGAQLLQGPLQTNLLSFGEVGGVELGGLLPVKPPEWLGGALEFGSLTAEKLLGSKILYKWRPRLGGWAVGTVTAVNTDKKKKVGKEVCNFLVHYAADDDTSDHVLHACTYASNEKAVADSWVLLGEEA